MVNNSFSQDYADDEIVEALLKLPVRNLEGRIRQLESEIQTRAKLNWNALSDLGTHELQLQDKIERLHYSFLIDGERKERQRVTDQIIKLEIKKIDEKVACFRDMSELKHRLQEAKEALELNRQKARIVES